MLEPLNGSVPPCLRENLPCRDVAEEGGKSRDERAPALRRSVNLPLASLPLVCGVSAPEGTGVHFQMTKSLPSELPPYCRLGDGWIWWKRTAHSRTVVLPSVKYCAELSLVAGGAMSSRTEGMSLRSMTTKRKRSPGDLVE